MRETIDATFTMEQEEAAQPIVALTNGALAWDQFTDDALVVYINAAAEERKRLVDMFREIETAGKAEIERRLRDRGARALPNKDYEIEIEEEFSAYAYDLTALKAAKDLLPEDEGAKVLRHVPEATTVTPAHDEPGKAVSIAALLRKYGTGNAVGDALAAGMRRDKIGEKLVIRPRKVGA